MAERRRLVKLVRDRVGEFIGSDGRATYEPVDPDDHARLLRGKLIEEATEYLLDPSREELADVYQVVLDLAAVDLGIKHEDLERIRVDKAVDRGGFREGVGMFCTSTAKSKEEGGHG